MAGVVIIHAQEDNAPAHALAAKIRALGLNTATEFASLDALRAAIEASDVTVALWSPRSAALPELVGEAAFARGLGVLVHARMHNMPAPREFVADPTIDLTGWKGEDNFSGWINLRAAIEGVMQAGAPSGFGARSAPARAAPTPRAPDSLYAVAAQAAPPPPRYEAESYEAAPPERETYARRDTFTPRDYAAAPPRAPESGGGMRLALIGLVTFAVIAGVGIGGYSLIQGGASSAEIEAAWNALDKTDPAALRAFLNDEGGGRFRRPAEIALEGLEVEAFRVAREADTVEALQAFLTTFPESRHSSRARGRLAELRQNQSAIDEPPPLAPTDEPPPATFGGAQPEAAPPPDDLDLPGGPVALTPGASPPPDEAPFDEFANPTN